MSLDAMDWVWENSQSKGVARLVMLAIADRVVGADCKAYASLTALQERANAGRSTVIGAIRDLTETGELEIVEGESGRNGAAVYRIPKALGHVRTDIRARRESVQKLNQSTESGASQIGAESAPITGAGGSGIGAETEPIDITEADPIGADSAPIHPGAEKRIGADSGPESVQILDGIGAVSAPQNNYKQLLNQEQIYIPGAPVAEAKPKRRRTATTDALFPVADKTSTKAAKTDPGERFEEFYKTYPRHKAPGRAETAWIKAVKAGAEPQVLIEAAARYAAKCERECKDVNFLPYPSTWLNDRGWEDEDEPQGNRARRPGQHIPYLEDPDDERPYAGDL